MINSTSTLPRITRLMFEEEQRLRRGLELSEMQKLDKLLGSLHLSFLLELVVVASQFIKILALYTFSGPVASASRHRPKSAYAAPPGSHQGPRLPCQTSHGGPGLPPQASRGGVRHVPLSLPPPPPSQPAKNPPTSISSDSCDKPVW